MFFVWFNLSYFLGVIGGNLVKSVFPEMPWSTTDFGLWGVLCFLSHHVEKNSK